MKYRIVSIILFSFSCRAGNICTGQTTVTSIATPPQSPRQQYPFFRPTSSPRTPSNQAQWSPISTTRTSATPRSLPEPRERIERGNINTLRDQQTHTRHARELERIRITPKRNRRNSKNNNYH